MCSIHLRSGTLVSTPPQPTTFSTAYLDISSRRQRRSPENVRPYLEPGGVLFGSTILGRGVPHGRIGRRLMQVYNEKAIFSNADDDERGLEQGLASVFEDVEIEVVGTVALFAATARPCEAGRAPPRTRRTLTEFHYFEDSEDACARRGRRGVAPGSAPPGKSGLPSRASLVFMRLRASRELYE